MPPLDEFPAFPLSDLTKTSEQKEGWRNGVNQFVSAGHSTSRDQWLRKISLVVYGNSKEGDGLEISMLRINWSVKKHTNQTPNILYARIYNMAPQTMAKVIEFKRVQLKAGYQTGTYGLIFDGTVTQYVRGKENAVDSYLDIFAGDGDNAFKNAIILQQFEKGVTDEQVIKALMDEYDKLGVSPGTIPIEAARERALRSKTLAGPVKDYLRQMGNKYVADAFIRDGKIHMVKRNETLPGEAWVLSPSTGLVGMPEVTPQGIQAKCLLNAKLNIASRVKIDSNILSGVPYQPGTASKTDANGNVIAGNPTGGMRYPAATQGQQLSAAFTSPVGEYKILLLEHNGDTRSNPWYSDMICIAIGSDGKVMPTGDPSEALGRSYGKGEG